MKFFDLEKLRVIIKNATDLDISYAYDDLVFPDYSAFIIKFDREIANNFTCYFHEDCLPEEEEKIYNNLEKEFSRDKSILSPGGKFNMLQKGEEVEIHFL